MRLLLNDYAKNEDRARMNGLRHRCSCHYRPRPGAPERHLSRSSLRGVTSATAGERTGGAGCSYSRYFYSSLLASRGRGTVRLVRRLPI